MANCQTWAPTKAEPKKRCMWRLNKKSSQGARASLFIWEVVPGSKTEAMKRATQRRKKYPWQRVITKVPVWTAEMRLCERIQNSSQSCLVKWSREFSTGSCFLLSSCPLPSELHMCSDIVSLSIPLFMILEDSKEEAILCQLTLSRNLQGTLQCSQGCNQKG